MACVKPLPLALLSLIIILAHHTNSNPAKPLEQKSYDGYRLLRTSNLPDAETAKILSSNLDGIDGINFWVYPKAQAASEIMASPEAFTEVQAVLKKLSLESHVVQENIGKLIDEERAAAFFQAKSLEYRQTSGHRMTWKNYHSYDDIYGYCKYLAETYAQRPSPSGALVSMEHIGTTTENRNMVLIRLQGTDKRKKLGIWLDGGIHAREWISPATVTHMLNTLVEDKGKSQELIDAFDWYIVPVINIDGYDYTRSSDRMWRKTRSRNQNTRCIGTDPNRNFDYKWGKEGSSSNPCSETYAGTEAFSEPETRAVRDTILRLRNDIAMYIAFHSYSQLLLLPWSGNRTKPDDYKELEQVAIKGQAALRTPYGTKYQVGTAPDILYVASGGADDWAKATAGIKYSYTYELRDTGNRGFLLPSEQIIPSGIETFNGVKAMALELRNRRRSV